jgi:large subunit ribosomal protein L32
MGVPKRRVSHARQGDRRAHHALTLPKLEECPHCHQPKQPHHACPNCGWYGGREAVQIKQRTKPEPPAA